jgi:hypothetical protein
MSTERSHPPALAVWLLRRLYPERNREAITGDLLERFRDGRSDSWFWRQVLVAILVGSSSQSRLRWTEICLAVAGTTLIWCVPWGRIFPIAAMTTSKNWGTQLQWLVVIEIVTALMVLPLFAVLLRLWRTFHWGNLVRVFFISAMLFAGGDLVTTWWCVNHPVMSRPQATRVVILQLGWVFATLLISARVARRLPYPSRVLST